MDSKIEFTNVDLIFETFHSKGLTLKELCSSLFSKQAPRLDTRKYKALDNINITISHGDRLGIVGRNGAGKSSFLKSLCRIYEPSNGNINVIGTVAPLLEIGAGFNPELSGRENIYLNGAILGNSIKALKVLESSIIDFSGLQDFIDTPVKYYSTGMYLKLAFSIATAVKPDILVLDELFAGGDIDFIKKAREKMQYLIDESSIMVFVSHQLDLLEEFCNRVIWIDSGKIIADGKPEVIIKRYLNNDRI